MLFDLFSSAKFTCHILCIYKFEVIIIAQKIYLPGVENSEKDEHKLFAGNIAAKLFSRLASASNRWFVKGFFLISILLHAFFFFRMCLLLFFFDFCESTDQSGQTTTLMFTQLRLLRLVPVAYQGLELELLGAKLFSHWLTLLNMKR